MKETKLFDIKYAEPRHVKGILDVYLEWLNFKGIFPDKLIEPDHREAILSCIKNSTSTKKYIVAETKDGKIIGTCYIDTSFLKLQTIRLGNMMVKSGFRKKGVGSVLLDKVMEFATENNVIKIWLWTQEELAEAIRLYKKKGFILEGKQKAQFCGKDALLYGLILKK